MSMHLEGPWLSTTGKKKTKRKYRNAEQARKARELDESWKDLLKQHGVEQEARRKKRALASEVWTPEPRTYRGSDSPKIPSLPFTAGPCVKAPDKVYTGEEMLGIGQLHKSNAVPVFRQQDAEDIARMRR